ncbi:GGDEF and EAL domain-containing protein [Candidatus Xianfuyuplasma coldseepsis]|uniref:EAL domain-containing protein n=1 Tax=Candidatus Xianfuyuplasma coldseepsis TaxID=2782163 RepID=A0A7L7KPH7_9MOLU|nr:GGDEF and EAL domain-containing protein [Xianfuyuplasma coldseepsis]QMS84691.1 EAL domain-containing protein [Xianfuyuplasma coldseepsis]
MRLWKWFGSLTITIKYIITITLIIIPIIIGAIYTANQNDDMDYYGLSYNLVQTQRMRTILIADLSQRLYDKHADNDLFAVTQVQEMMNEELDKYDATMTMLTDGDDTSGLYAADSSVIITHLDTINPMIDSYIADANSVIADPTDDDALDQLLNQTYEIDHELYQLMVTYEKTYLSGYQSLSAFNVMIIIVTILFLGLSLFLLRVLRKNEFYANYDNLTKLRSRASLFTDIAQLNPEEFRVVYLDIKNFKSINEVYGNNVGDDLLIQLANRIKSICGKKRMYRFGGDEFTILLHQRNMFALEDLEIFRQQLLEPFIDNRSRQHHLILSMGIVETDVGILDFEQKINLAIDLCADSSGYRQRPMVCDTKEVTANRILLKNSIITAIERRQIQPFFQPLHWSNGTIKGFESLARWNLGDSIINPGTFLPLVNRNGMGYELDINMVEMVAESLSKIFGAREDLELHVSINLAIDTLINIQIERLIEILTTQGIQGNHIIFEILEDVVINDKTRQKLRILKQHGFHIALDDFTTGATSFEYLKYEEVDFVKIDKQVLEKISIKDDYQHILADLVHMIHTSHKKVIVEGVETKDELDILVDMGVDIIQGYYFSKPLTLNDAISYIKQQKSKNS